MISGAELKKLRVIKEARVGLIQPLKAEGDQGSFLVMQLITDNQDENDPQEVLFGMDKEHLDQILGCVFHIYTSSHAEAELLAKTFGSALAILNHEID